VHPAMASRVTAVPRKSLKVRPVIPARLQARIHADANACGGHGCPM